MRTAIDERNVNPLTRLDYPDPDVIRVDDTYYMVSTTMHFMPGCEILRSYDLVNWEHATYVYDRLDSTPAQTLSGDENIYGKGMWAASIRYHKGTFYIVFVANDTHKTYLYTSRDINGPWKKSNIEGFYHDCSILFDDDDRVYIVSGNRNIYLVELEADLSGPKKDGINKLIVSDKDNPMLGYEGAHFYKINGKYYIFFIHSLPDRWRRVEACFMAEKIDGEYVGGDIFDDDRGYCGQGVAQGGIVDTPDGKWYAVLFQDSGAVGRLPILVPITWEQDRPVFGVAGKVPDKIEINSTRPDYKYKPLVESDDFKCDLKSCWQFNHEPDEESMLHDKESGEWTVINNKICKEPVQARNTLTQRMRFPQCTASVTIDATKLNDGDYAGLMVLQGCYSYIAVTKRDNDYYIEFLSKEGEAVEPVIVPCELIHKIRFRITADFENMKDEAAFYYSLGDEEKWIEYAVAKMYFRMDHFTGSRFGLCSYATEQLGGRASFSEFIYE